MLMQGKSLHVHVSTIRPFLAPVTPFRKSIQTMGRVFDDGSWVIESFNDQPGAMEVHGTSQTIRPAQLNPLLEIGRQTGICALGGTYETPVIHRPEPARICGRDGARLLRKDPQTPS